MPANDIVMGAGTAAFSRRSDGVISSWNEIAEFLMYTPAEQVIGQPCRGVMAGRDVFGNDFCGENCACQRMAAGGLRIRPFRLNVTDARGRALMLRVSILPSDGANGPELVHFLEPAIANYAFEVFSAADDGYEAPRGLGWTSLTRRELQVLRHLAHGHPTGEIAKRLKISPTTVRNHICRCLHKLEVHTRIEAVGVARRLSIV